MRRMLNAAVVWGILGIAATASADPIRTVTAGNIGSNDDSSSFLIIGSGFRLSGEGPFIAPLENCGLFLSCAAGTTVDLSTTVTPSVIGDPAIVEGVTYEGYNYYGGVFLGGGFSIAAGSIAVPSLAPDGFAEASTPFTFTGVLRGYDNFDLAGTPLFSINLRGAGTATMQFNNQPQLGGTFGSGLSYEFEDTAPVPEPATMFLIGSGLCGLAVRRKRA